MRKTALSFLLALISAWSGLRAQTFNLQTDRENITSLDGLWRFHTGDDPQWADPNFDDSHWPLLRSDESWTEQGFPNYGGYAWYRFTVQVPDGSKPTGFLLTEIQTGYQLYVDGKRIGSAGSAMPTRDPVTMALPETFRLPAYSAGPHTIQIALRVWNYEPFAAFAGGGTLQPGNAVGDPVLLVRHLHWYQDTHALGYVNAYASALLTALVGITIFALFLFRREDREYLWFSVLLLAEAAELAGIILVNLSSVPLPPVDFLNMIADGLSAIAALAFFSIVLHARRSSLWWAAWIAAVLSPLTMTLYYFQWTPMGTVYAVQLLCLLPAYVWITIALATGALRKDISALLLVAPAALLYGYFIADNILFVTWALGWQSRLNSLREVLLLRRPFHLHPEDVIHYIFVLALLIFLVRRFSLARQEETRLAQEMEAAHNIQAVLVPAVAPCTPGFAVESVYLPASEVGGDFFQVLPAEDGSLLIVVGDVSGKGLKAAMTVSTIVGALRGCVLRKPAAVLAYLNRVLQGQISGFATCCAALMSADGILTVANAGHLSPYRNGEELVLESGLPLGILADGTYAEASYPLKPGDRLTFVSDGVVEATNERRELFGFERTQAISGQSAEEIAETAKRFGQQDDITVLSVTRSGARHAAFAGIG